jgi:hypothetical protein
MTSHLRENVSCDDPTSAHERTNDETTQDMLVSALVERLLGALEPGRVVIASLDREERLVGIENVAVGSCKSPEDCAWELRSAVARGAASVIVGYHTTENERLARTVATAARVPVLRVVIAQVGARSRRRSDVAPANGWLRRSTIGGG